MQPTKKSPAIESLLTKLSGDTRQAALAEGRCIKPPIGCGQPVGEFNSGTEEKEYQISGWCEECQRKAFLPPEKG
jgi:hypothetical protein